MAGKKIKKIKPGIASVATASDELHTKSKTINKTWKFMLPAVIIITLLVYLPSLQNDFIVNWDDNGYILEYETIQKLNSENIKIIFSDFYKGNYHPLTTLFYAVEYSLVGAKPFLYHLNNLILHLLNVLLIYTFIKRLSGKALVAAFSALFFGIHPMHVESVAWISERKDVLYTFFFFLSLILYQTYVSKNRGKALYYLLAVLSFLLSLMSKSAAVSLPVILLLIDYFTGRKFTIKTISEKLIFFLLSIVFGVIAVLSQGETGAIQNLTPLYSVLDRFFIVSYATVTYLAKLFAPLELSAMYPYPQLTGGSLPMSYYLAGIILSLIITLFIIYLRKNRTAVFGTLFFLSTIALVLQIIPVGGAVLAERYTYVPYTGLFFFLGVAYYNLSIGKRTWQIKLFPAIRLITVFYIIFFSFLTYERIGLWKNGEILFTDVIAKNPTLHFAYGNRAYYYKENQMWEKAIKDYDVAIKLNPEEKGIFANRAAALYQTGRIKEAIADFHKAIKRESENTDALLGLANSYSSINEHANAIPYYNKYLSLKTDNSKAWLWRGVAYYYCNEMDSTIMDADACLALNPSDDEGYYWKGLAYHHKGDFKQAVSLLDKSIELNPVRGEVYSWRGLSKQNMRLFEEAIKDYDLALKYSPNDAAAYINRSASHYQLKNIKAAINDIEAAIKLGSPVNEDFHRMLISISSKK